MPNIGEVLAAAAAAAAATTQQCCSGLVFKESFRLFRRICVMQREKTMRMPIASPLNLAVGDDTDTSISTHVMAATTTPMMMMMKTR